MSERKICGEPAAPMYPARGLSYACVLDPGHQGDHERGGTCGRHGDYIGEHCPGHPNCLVPSPERERILALQTEIRRLREAFEEFRERMCRWRCGEVHTESCAKATRALAETGL